MIKKLRFIWKILTSDKYMVFVRKKDTWYYHWSTVSVTDGIQIAGIVVEAVNIGKQEHANLEVVKEIVSQK